MQLKTADDRAPDIEALAALRRRPDVDARTTRLIEDEIWSIRLGAKAESDAAYQLDFDLVWYQTLAEAPLAGASQQLAS